MRACAQSYLWRSQYDPLLYTHPELYPVKKMVYFPKVTIDRVKLKSLMILIFPAQQFVISTPLSPVRPYMLMVVILGLFLVFSKVARYKRSNVDIAISLVFIYMLYSALWADNILLAIQMAGGIIILLLTYFVVRIILSGGSISELKMACVLASKLFIILSFLYYIAGILLHYVVQVPLTMEEGAKVAYLYGVYFEGGVIPRLRGFSDSPNNFGMYAVFFLVSLYLQDKISKTYVISIIILMILTLSNTTYLAMILIGIIFCLKKYRVIPLTFGMASILGGLVIYAVNSRLLVNVSTDNADIINRISTGSGRWEIFRYGLKSFEERPWFGHGLNQAREILEPLRSVKSTHNNFIEILLEGGLVGFIVYTFGLVIIITKARSLKSDRKLNLWAVSSLSGFFVFSNANVTLYADSTIIMLAVLASMSASRRFKTDRIVKYINVKPQHNPIIHKYL
jgi:O-antigen ligase